MRRENEEKVKSRMILKLFIIIILLAGAIFSLKIAPNYKNNEITDKINLIINYSNVTSKIKQDIIIDENDVIYLSMKDIRNYYDEHIYYDKQYNQIVTSSETKLAVLKLNSNKMKINGIETKINGSVIIENDEYYLPISEMENVYNVEVTKVGNKVIIESLDDELSTAETVKKVSVKSNPTFFSRTVEKLSEDTEIVIAQNNANNIPEGWVRIRTNNGNFGYIEEKNIENIVIQRQAKVDEPIIEGHISLVWEYFSEFGKAPNNAGIKYNGVNVVSPSFFYLGLRNTDKNNLVKSDVISQANILENVGAEGIAYINWAKNNGYQVWPKVTNDTLTTTIDEFSCIINDFELREIMISDIVKYAKKYDLEGINLDFEFIYEEDKDALSKFIIELAPQLKDIGVCLSVDVTAPDGSENWSLCYDRNLIGEVADYIVFMGYDQYGTNTIGTTSGYGWLERSVNKFLNQEEVPAEKIILGLPFYTKIWKTKDGKVVDSSVVSIKYVESVIPSNATKEWKEDLQQYYIEYEQGGYVYKMWIEDEQSFNKKIQLVKQYNLAGAAYWRKGFDGKSIWKVIKNNLDL